MAAAAVRGDLRDLLQARLPDPAAVRAEIRAVRNAGLSPDLPPPLLHRLAMVSSLWGISADDAREYLAAAVAAGDEAAMAKMLRQKRRFAEVGLAELTAAVDRTLRPGGVPALGTR